MSMQKKFKDVYNDSLINFTKVSRIFKYRLKKKLLFPFIFIFRQIQNSKVIQHSYMFEICFIIKYFMIKQISNTYECWITL